MFCNATTAVARGLARPLGIALAALTLSAATLTGGTAAPAQAAVKGSSAFTITPSMIKSAGPNHWIATGTASIPQGTGSIQIGMNCPNGLIASSGAFALNAAGQSTQVSLSFDGPRIDESPPAYSSWGWHFFFPGGAPSGVSGLFTLYCVN
jgi:hypothetical protein